jgi:hypothetical protein
MGHGTVEVIPPDGRFGHGTVWVENEGSVKATHVIEALAKGVVWDEREKLFCQLISCWEAPGRGPVN